MTRAPSSPPPPKQKKPPAWGMSLLLLVPAALGAALYLDSLPGKPFVPPAPPERPAPPPAISPARLEILENRIAELERKYAALAAAPVQTTTATPPPEEPSANAPSPVASEELLTLKEDMERLKERLGEESPWKNEQLVALYRLEKTLRGGKPYGKELDALLENPGLPERVHMKLEPLAESAPEGIATLPQLTRAFEESFETYLSGPPLSPEAGGSTWSQIKHNLSSLVTIRKLGDDSGDSDTARLARAQTYMAEGEVTPAIGEISALSDEAQPYFEEWLKQASMRRGALLAIDRARSMLEEEGRRGVPAQGPGSV